jgi:hypothetical protein
MAAEVSAGLAVGLAAGLAAGPGIVGISTPARAGWSEPLAIQAPSPTPAPNNMPAATTAIPNRLSRFAARLPVLPVFRRAAIPAASLQVAGLIR